MLGSTDEDDTCYIYELKIAIDNVEKWLNIFKKTCSVNTARFLKFACQFFNVMRERVKAP